MRMTKDIAIDFKSKVDRNGPQPHIRATVVTRCHQWVGSINTNGYGIFHYCGKRIGAHRMAWALKYGWNSVKNPRIMICHKCDNRRCVRLSHLFLGNHQLNAIDMWRKGRHPILRGSSHGLSKLTEKNVSVILKRFSRGKSLTELARKYKVSITAIRFIVKGKTWTHVH